MNLESRVIDYLNKTFAAGKKGFEANEMFEGMNDGKKRFKYKAMQPDGNIVTGWDTADGIKKLRQNLQIVVEGEEGYTDPIATATELAKKASGVLNSERVKNLLGQYEKFFGENDGNTPGVKPVKESARGEKMSEEQEYEEPNEEEEYEEEEEEEGKNLLTAEAVTENVKNAVAVVASGSVDVIKSTAKNTWEALVHAVMAGAGFLAIAATGLIAKKTVEMLPGAASNIGKMINNILENTSRQVKLITSNALEAAKEAQTSAGDAAESAEEAKDHATDAEIAAAQATKVEHVDGEAKWVDADSTEVVESIEKTKE